LIGDLAIHAFNGDRYFLAVVSMDFSPGISFSECLNFLPLPLTPDVIYASTSPTTPMDSKEVDRPNDKSYEEIAKTIRQKSIKKKRKA